MKWSLRVVVAVSYQTEKKLQNQQILQTARMHKRLLRSHSSVLFRKVAREGANLRTEVITMGCFCTDPSAMN
jgi:hypothetical protein